MHNTASLRARTTPNLSRIQKINNASADASSAETESAPYPKHYPKSDLGSPLRKVFNALWAADCKWDSGQDWQCPAHEDSRASLGVAVGKKVPVLLHCAAGCSPERVLKALNLTWASLGAKIITRRWTYTDENGEPLLTVTRRDLPSGKKQFYQQRADGRGSVKGVRRVLFDLPRLRAVCAGGGTVYLVEGEKSVDALNRLPEFSFDLSGRSASVATTALAGAAQAWPAEFSWMLRGARRVVVVADNDVAGYERARKVFDALTEAKAAGQLAVGSAQPRKFALGLVEVRASATHGNHDDVVEHLASGATLADLQAVSRETLDNILAVKKGEEIEAQVQDGSAHTDVAAVALLWQLHGERLRFCPPKKAWFVWTGEFWRPDEKDEIYDYARTLSSHLFAEGKKLAGEDERKKQFSWAKMLCSGAKLDTVVKLASRTAEFKVSPRELNADPFLLCCENGTLDLKTGELREHRQTDLITVMAPVQFVEGARDRAWSSFLRQVLGKDRETARFLKRAFYITLMGTATEKSFFNLYDGNVGNTGKTTFLECIKAVIGDYCGVVNAETFLANPTYGGSIRSDLAACDGKRMVLSNEIPAGRKLDSDMLKKLTDGGGTYMYRQLHEKAYTAPITFTIWLDGNKTARAMTDDDPLFARWRLIAFDRQIEKPDPHWRERNVERAEFRAAVLWWIVSARESYWKDGLGSSLKIEKATKEVRAAMDPLREFWEDCIDFGPENWDSWHNLSTAKTIFSRENPGDREISATTFRELLRSKGATPVTRRVNGKETRGWSNLKVKENALSVV